MLFEALYMRMFVSQNIMLHKLEKEGEKHWEFFLDTTSRKKVTSDFQIDLLKKGIYFFKQIERKNDKTFRY